MVADDEIRAQAARILRELPAHPAARRFCFAGWDRRDYQGLDAQLCRSGTPTLRRLLPDESILVGPASLPSRLTKAEANLTSLDGIQQEWGRARR
jgi:hypothetical protein